MRSYWGLLGTSSSTSRLDTCTKPLQLHVRSQHQRSLLLAFKSLPLGRIYLRIVQSSIQNCVAKTDWQRLNQLCLVTPMKSTCEGWPMPQRLSPIDHPYISKPSIWMKLKKFSGSGSEIDTQLLKSSYLSFRSKNLKPSPQTFLKKTYPKSRTNQDLNKRSVIVARKCWLWSIWTGFAGMLNTAEVWMTWLRSKTRATFTPIGARVRTRRQILTTTHTAELSQSPQLFRKT